MTKSPTDNALNPLDLGIIIPAWNESRNLELLLPALRQTLSELRVSYEIIVVDGGSTDDTPSTAAHLGARVLRQQERGYGGALLEGFAATSARYLVTMDADLSHRPTFLRAFWAERDNADLLIASRYIPGGQADVSSVRILLSRILNRVYRRVLSLEIQDMSSGFRMYRRDIVVGLEVRARDFDFLEEILIRVHDQGWRIKEVPFHFMVRGSGRSHIRLVRFGIAFLRTLLRLWRLRNSLDSADYDYRAFNSPIWLQRYWQRARHRIVLGYLDSQEQILDIGCGSSRIIIDLAKAVGLDILFNKLRWLRPRHESVVQADGCFLPFRDGAFSTVICSEMIEHVPDCRELWTEMWRVLKPGGILILGTPDYGRLLWVLIEKIYGAVLPDAYAGDHITHYERKGLERRMRDYGYDVLDCRYVGGCEMIFKLRKPASERQSALGAVSVNPDDLCSLP